jgi:hypothetical protein
VVAKRHHADVSVGLTVHVEDPKPPVVAASAITAEAIATAAPSVVPAVTAATSASVAPEPADVELTIETNVPKGVDVLLDGKSIGSAPGVVKLPRGDAKVTLTLKAPGYVPAEVHVTPSANGVVSAPLTKAAVHAPVRPRTPGEIENPF